MGPLPKEELWVQGKEPFSTCAGLCVHSGCQLPLVQNGQAVLLDLSVSPFPVHLGLDLSAISQI